MNGIPVGRSALAAKASSFCLVPSALSMVFSHALALGPRWLDAGLKISALTLTGFLLSLGTVCVQERKAQRPLALMLCLFLALTVPQDLLRNDFSLVNFLFAPLILAAVLGLGISDRQIRLAFSLVAYGVAISLGIGLLMLVVHPSEFSYVYPSLTDGYKGIWTVLSPFGVRWESPMGGPQVTSACAAVLILYGLVESPRRRMAFLLLGVLCLAMAGARVGYAGLLFGLILVCQRSHLRRARNLMAIIAAAFLLTFALVSGFSGRLSVWPSYLDFALRNSGPFTWQEPATLCSINPSNCIPNLPGWAGDAHNSVLDVPIRFGWVPAAFLLVLLVYLVLIVWRSKDMQTSTILAIPFVALGLTSVFLHFSSMQLPLYVLFLAALTIPVEKSKA